MLPSSIFIDLLQKSVNQLAVSFFHLNFLGSNYLVIRFLVAFGSNPALASKNQFFISFQALEVAYWTQDMTVSDQVIENVHPSWNSLGPFEWGGIKCAWPAQLLVDSISLNSHELLVLFSDRTRFVWLNPWFLNLTRSRSNPAFTCEGNAWPDMFGGYQEIDREFLAINDTIFIQVVKNVFATQKFFNPLLGNTVLFACLAQDFIDRVGRS